MEVKDSKQEHSQCCEQLKLYESQIEDWQLQLKTKEEEVNSLREQLQYMEERVNMKEQLIQVLHTDQAQLEKDFHNISEELMKYKANDEYRTEMEQLQHTEREYEDWLNEKQSGRRRSMTEEKSDIENASPVRRDSQSSTVEEGWTSQLRLENKLLRDKNIELTKKLSRLEQLEGEVNEQKQINNELYNQLHDLQNEKEELANKWAKTLELNQQETQEVQDRPEPSERKKKSSGTVVVRWRQSQDSHFKHMSGASTPEFLSSALPHNDIKTTSNRLEDDNDDDNDEPHHYHRPQRTITSINRNNETPINETTWQQMMNNAMKEDLDDMVNEEMEREIQQMTPLEQVYLQNMMNELNIYTTRNKEEEENFDDQDMTSFGYWEETSPLRKNKSKTNGIDYDEDGEGIDMMAFQDDDEDDDPLSKIMITNPKNKNRNIKTPKKHRKKNNHKKFWNGKNIALCAMAFIGSVSVLSYYGWKYYSNNYRTNNKNSNPNNNSTPTITSKHGLGRSLRRK